MEFFNDILFLPFLNGVIFSAAAVFVLLFPPKKINSLYGYRTASSMRSEEAWKFSQTYSAKLLLLAGAALVVLSFAGLLIRFSEKSKLTIGLVLSLTSVLFVLYFTEKAINKRFSKN